MGHPVYATYAKRKWLGRCADRNALLILLFHHITILVPVLIQESPISHHWLMSWGRILYFVGPASRYKFLLITNLTHFFMYLFISSLYMFRAPQCSSSGDRIILIHHPGRGKLSYLVPLGSENISAPYFMQCFFQGGYYPQTESKTTPPSPKTEITNILFYILNFASIIKFKM